MLADYFKYGVTCSLSYFFFANFQAILRAFCEKISTSKPAGNDGNKLLDK